MDACCVPLARIESCATGYEPASATIVVSSSTAHLERGRQGLWMGVRRVLLAHEQRKIISLASNHSFIGRNW